MFFVEDQVGKYSLTRLFRKVTKLPSHTESQTSLFGLQAQRQRWDFNIIIMSLKSLNLLLADAPNPCETDGLTPPRNKKEGDRVAAILLSFYTAASRVVPTGASGVNPIWVQRFTCSLLPSRFTRGSWCVFSLGSRVIHPPTNSWQGLNLALLGLVCSG